MKKKPHHPNLHSPKPHHPNLHSPNVISEALAAAQAKGHTRLIALKVRVRGVRCTIGLN